MAQPASINETNFGDEIKKIREEKHYSLRQAAQQMGVSASYLSNLENKKTPSNPKPMTLDKIADGLRTDKDTIYKLAGFLPFSVLPKNVGSGRPTVANVHVPVYGEIHAGNPTYADENIIGHISITEKCMKRYGLDNLFALRIKGDSMSKVVPEGYTAVFVKDAAPEDGEIVAVLLDGDEATIKRYKETSLAYIFEPDSYNPIYQPITVSKQKADTGYCRILGKYLYATSEQI